jgi:hydroxymethylbilane synthase
VGTSALRRRAQLLAAWPDVEVVELRGNVDTRLAKREAGEVDALVLAAAGLERLGRPIGTQLDFIPAPGQGVIAIQAREGSPSAAAALAADDAGTHACLDEERAAVRLLGATCHTPVGVLAIDGRVRGFAGLPDGSAWLSDEASSGEELARRMLAAGAADLLREAEGLAA